MAQRYGPYVTVINGNPTFVAGARRWTAEDYDLIEELIAAGFRYKDMLPYFTDPPVTLHGIKGAVRTAKIDYPFKAGRPRKDET